jgi:hypothetical protein
LPAYISDDFEDSMVFEVPKGSVNLKPKENDSNERRMFEDLAKMSMALRAHNLI